MLIEQRKAHIDGLVGIDKIVCDQQEVLSFKLGRGQTFDCEQGCEFHLFFEQSLECLGELISFNFCCNDFPITGIQ